VVDQEDVRDAVASGSHDDDYDEQHAGNREPGGRACESANPIALLDRAQLKASKGEPGDAER
jgi:hypothetical protein